MARTEAMVGDVGTVYRVPTYDDDLEPANFDPTTAVVKQIIFDMPGASAALTRNATAAQIEIDGVMTWCLTYTVLAADVVAGGFHQSAGKITLQGYVEFSSAQKWHSSLITKDHLDRDLTVSANLS